MALREILRRDPLSQLSMRIAVTVPISCIVRDAVALMRDNRVGAVTVVGDDGLPIGMFTEKLLIRLLAHKPQAMDEPVGTHMSARIVCLKKDAPIATLIATMQEHNLRWVCVVDDTGRPIALTGLRGVIEFVVEHFARLVNVEPMESPLAMQDREGA